MLLAVAARTRLHEQVVKRLRRQLERQLPSGLDVETEFGVRLGTDGRLPDLASCVLDDPLESLLELAEDDPAIPLDEDQAEELVRTEWALRQAELADGRPGDEVGVHAAFEALREAGYVAELHVGYTMSDGWDELGELVVSSGAEGLVFSHGQDSARLAESPADLFVGFDCVSGDAAKMAVIGQAIAQAMTDQGLTVEWNGTAKARVLVKGLDWRQALPED